MNLETKITIYKFTPQLFTLTRKPYGPLPASIEVNRKNPLSVQQETT